MNIGIDCRELLHDSMTGIGRFLLTSLETYPKLENKHKFVLFGNQYTNFDCSDALKNEIFEQVVIYERIRFLWDQFLLSKAINDYKIDIFFSPYYKAPLSSSAKIVITIHDVIPLTFPKYKRNIFRKFYEKNFTSLSIKKSAKIVTVSEYSKSEILRLFDTDPDKIRVIPNAVPRNFSPRASSECKEFLNKLNLPENFVLYVGAFLSHKNVNRLIESYANLPISLKKNYSLVLLGNGEQENKLRFLAKDLRINDKVIFLSYVQDLPLLYSSAKLFIFPSLCEGFGLPVLEAMACGTPVICSSSSSLPEVIGDAGLLFDPSNIKDISEKIQKALDNFLLLSELREKGLKRVKNFDAKKSAKLLLDTFEEIASLRSQ